MDLNTRCDLEELNARIVDNVKRVVKLVELYRRMTAHKKGGRSPVHAVDILRSAVVLLHATVEECIRGLGRISLPLASEETVNAIPLAGTKWSRTPEKFKLGSLMPHRGKSVNDLLQESAEYWLSRLTFNDTNEALGFFQNFGIGYDGPKQYLKHMSSLMSRRHKIVHEADRTESRGPGHHRARSLSADQVNRWAKSSLSFCDIMWAEVAEALSGVDASERHT